MKKTATRKIAAEAIHSALLFFKKSPVIASQLYHTRPRFYTSFAQFLPIPGAGCLRPFYSLSFVGFFYAPRRQHLRVFGKASGSKKAFSSCGQSLFSLFPRIFLHLCRAPGRIFGLYPRSL